MSLKNMPKVEIFTKNHCSLCAKAEDILLSVQNEMDFELIKVDITQESEIYQEYIERIPVVKVNGEKCFQYYIDRDIFKEILKRC